MADAQWAVITSGAQGQGDGTIEFRVDQNPDPVARSCAIVIGGQKITLEQQPAACRYDVASPPESVSANGGSFQVALRTHAVCEWQARSDASWLVLSSTSGRGEASIGVTAAANDGAARSGQLLIANSAFRVTQGGLQTPSPAPAPTPAPTPSQIELSGTVASLKGSCPRLQFSIGTVPISTSAQTDFSRGRCRDLRNGMRVDVTGLRAADGHIDASLVELPNGNNK